MLRALVAWLALAYNVRAMVRDHPRALQLPVETEEVVITEAAAPEPERGPGDAHMARKALLEDGQALLDDGGGNMQVLVSGEGDAAVPLQLTDADFDFEDLVPVEPVEPEPTRRQYVGPAAAQRESDRRGLDDPDALPLDGVFSPAAVRYLDENAAHVAFGSVVGVLLLWATVAVVRGASADRPVPSAGEGAQHLYERFVRAARRFPDRAAVDCGGSVTTYHELLRRCDTLAGDLVGLERGDSVVVLLERSLDLVLCHLALWKLGCAVVALSPREPPERVHAMAQDAQAKLVLARGPGDALAHGLVVAQVEAGRVAKGPAPTTRPPRPREHALADAAAVFFTSGSSGRPKGVELSHAHLSRFLDGVSLEWVQHLAPHEAPCRVLFASAPNWLTMAWQAWAPLLHGACVAVLPDQHELDPERTAAALRGVEVAVMVPSVVDAVFPFCRDFPPQSFSLRYLYGVGAPFPTAMARAFQSFWPQLTVINSYGLTETLECQFVVPRGLAALGLPDQLPAGVPAGACKVRLADEQLGRDEHEGQIWLGGSLPTYLPTAKAADHGRFLEKDGERWFRTGDRGRWLHRGGEKLLVVLGRADRQVKLRGMRVELDEVEAVLAAAGRCAVLKHREQLACFAECGAELLRAEAAAKLPQHMRPATIIEGPLPLLPSGKVDYHSLAARLEHVDWRPSLGEAADSGALAFSEAQQLLERGVDSLSLVSSMTRNHRRELAMMYTVMACCLPGTIIAHYRAEGVATAWLRTENFLNVHGWVLSFCDLVTAEHSFHSYILLSGYMHARESGRGWWKTLLIYAIFVLMDFPYQKAASRLGADTTAHDHGPFNGHRWFLLMMAIARAYTAGLQSLSCPPAVQVGAVGLGVLLFELCTRQYHNVVPEPEGHFYAEHGMAWLAQPPYWGRALFNHFFPSFVLRFTLYHTASFHYLRTVQLFVARAAESVVSPLAWSMVSLLLSLTAEFHLMPLNNSYPTYLELHHLGTPRTVLWYCVEVVVATWVSVSLMAACYLCPLRPLELLGRCTLPAFLFHGFFINRCRHLIASLPRAGGALAEASALCWLLVVVLGQTAAWGLLFYAAGALLAQLRRLAGQLGQKLQAFLAPVGAASCGSCGPCAHSCGSLQAGSRWSTASTSEGASDHLSVASDQFQ